MGLHQEVPHLVVHGQVVHLQVVQHQEVQHQKVLHQVVLHQEVLHQEVLHQEVLHQVVLHQEVQALVQAHGQQLEVLEGLNTSRTSRNSGTKLKHSNVNNETRLLYT